MVNISRLPDCQKICCCDVLTRSDTKHRAKPLVFLFSDTQKIAILKPNVKLASHQLSLNRARELQVFTPPKFCLSRRRCVAISGVTRTPEIGARIHTRGRWAAIGVSLHLLFLCSELPTHLLGVGGKKTKTDQHHRLSQRWIGAPC